MKATTGIVLLGWTVLNIVPGAAFAQAQTYPTKPIRFIAPFPPGGTSDIIARVSAQKLTEALGKQVLVDNRGGASGTIGYEMAAKAAPDGYTLLLCSMGGLVTNQFLYKRLPFDPMNDFAHISQLATAGQVLVVYPGVQAKTVQELIALAKASPGKLNVGSGGLGTTQHIVAEVFQSATGTKFTHVPYKGSILAVTATLAGEITMTFADMAPAVPHIKAGRLRALVVSSEQRSTAIPDVPTMADAGIKDWFPQTWWAMAAPKGTPPAIIKRINGEIAQFMKAPDVQEKFASLGLVPLHSTPERMAELVKVAAGKMGQVVKSAGLQPE
ncbi:MAG TPA: tripartite tricarboxylate transporter substrate binding protein [Burkholderiales bacterium]|nr:tripartite tricarboxylate transporter substrate binding protein [Burkholderiales bacterium]